MTVTLTIHGIEQDTELDIQLHEFCVGRDATCNYAIDSDGVSRFHFVIVTTDERVTLRDDRSRNGTYVNGRWLRGELELNDGDAIQAGPVRFTINIADGSESESTEANETIAFDEGTHLDERVDERLKGLSD